MRKVIYLVTVLVLTSQSYSQTGWVIQNSGTFCNLNSVYFTDANTGYTVGDSGSSRGVILKTSDGGTNWVRQINTTSGVLSVHFINSLTGFACGNSSGGHVLHKTTNGGTNWNSSFYSDQNAALSVFFINELTGFLSGYRPASKLVQGVILKTTDGGSNWNQQILWFPASFYSIFFINDLTGYLCGSSPMFKTTNTGVTWFQIAGSFYNSIHFINPVTGFAAGGNNAYKTTTGGSNWSSFYNQSCSGLYSVRFVNDQTGWVCGCLGYIYGTTNGGTNWVQQSAGTTTTLRSLSFANAQTGWAVGVLGRILKTTNGGITSVVPVSNEIPSEFSLSQNYPNPFNPTTQIEFQIAKSGLVKLQIFDALGREITTLVNESLAPGTYKADWDASNYPSGVYFYKLMAGEYTETRKMVLLK